MDSHRLIVNIVKHFQQLGGIVVLDRIINGLSLPPGIDNSGRTKHGQMLKGQIG